MIKQLQSALDALVTKPGQIVVFALLAGFAGYVLQVTVPGVYAGDANGSGALLDPPSPLALAGQEVYYQEGCQYCHTQNLRPFPWETARFADVESYGLYPLPTAAEYQFEAPLQRGSKRIGPDLSRIAGRLDATALTSLLKSKQEGKSLRADAHPYGYLFSSDSDLYPLFQSWKVRAMIQGGARFSDPYQKSVFMELEDKSRGEALVEYLLSRGAKQAEFAGSFYQ